MDQKKRKTHAPVKKKRKGEYDTDKHLSIASSQTRKKGQVAHVHTMAYFNSCMRISKFDSG